MYLYPTTCRKRHQNDISFRSSDWVCNAIAELDNLDSYDHAVLLQKLKEIEGQRNVSSKFSTLAGLGFVVGNDFEVLEKARGDLTSAMEALLRNPSDKQVREQANCPECRSLFKDSKSKSTQSKTKQCVYCDATDIFIYYEPLLFSHSTVTRGTKAASGEVEKAKDDKNKAVKDLEGEYFYLNKTGHGERVQQQGPSELEKILR